MLTAQAMVIPLRSEEMRQLYVDQPLVSALIERHHGSIDVFSARWATIAPQFAKGRSTIYRWLESGISGSRNEFYSFCSFLNVDPLAILDYERIGYFSRFYRLRIAFQHGLMRSSAWLDFAAIYLPSNDWPSDQEARRFWPAGWHRKSFVADNPAGTEGYARLKVAYEPDPGEVPRCALVAYRRLFPREEMWRPYGWIISDKGGARLFSENGYHASDSTRADGQAAFRTHFGTAPVEFRIASLHQFAVDVDFPCEDGSLPTFFR
jgi:hypothetical protein